MEIDIQLSPAVEPWPDLRDGILRAEEAGFGAAWVFDHFAGAMLGGTTMLECFTLLGAMAASTERIGLGSLVVNMANRNPGVLAMCAASVQHIAGGRFTLGLGAGTSPTSR
jgi:alkanesulfonate monooxygenase SsuD/methylene tetrahydromethanopterin reductase-like flavin-dependent oxidoreductase (luciferase family)